MNPELENLQELLDVLRVAGVRRYQNGGLVIELADVAPVPTPAEPPVTRQADRIAAAERAIDRSSPFSGSLYDHPSLFPGGKPKFPGTNP